MKVGRRRDRRAQICASPEVFDAGIERTGGRCRHAPEGAGPDRPHFGRGGERNRGSERLGSERMAGARMTQIQSWVQIANGVER